MRRLLRVLWPSTIRRQMTMIIFGAIVLVHVSGGLAEFMAKSGRLGLVDTEAAVQRADTIATLMRVQEPAERLVLLQQAKRIGMNFVLMHPRELAEKADADSTAVQFGWLIDSLFPQDSIIPQGARLAMLDLPTSARLAMVSGRSVMVFSVDPETELVATSLPTTIFTTDFVNPLSYYILAIVVLVSLFSVFSVRMITRPLDRMSRTLENTDAFLRHGDPVDEHGSAEIVRMAHALNDMQARIRTMLDARTRMLRSISHDLRTPLTRLRLRVERIGDPALRSSAVSDIDHINALIEETLDYLREDGRDNNRAERVDLPSLLQTICIDFADVGANIAYHGPDNVVARCSASEMTRAVSNLCDNALKFGTEVVVSLHRVADDIVIEVSDNGPGIPDHLYAKVVEPFFKTDTARSAGAKPGFGLGLAIVSEIVARNGGRFDLLDNMPHGLTARITLPAG